MRSLPRGAPDCMEAMCPITWGQIKVGSSNWLSWQQFWVRGREGDWAKELKLSPSPSGANKKHTHSSSGLSWGTKEEEEEEGEKISLDLCSYQSHYPCTSLHPQPLICDDGGWPCQALSHCFRSPAPLHPSTPSRGTHS